MTRWLCTRGACAAALALHVCVGAAATQLRWVDDPEQRFLAGDSTIAAARDESAMFGDDAPIFVLVEMDDALPAAELAARVSRWQAELGSLPTIERVWSYLDAPTVIWDAAGRPRIAALRDQVAGPATANPIVRKTFLRRDGRGLLLVVRARRDRTEARIRDAAALRDLDAWVSARDEPQRFSLAGTAVFRRDAEAAARRDVAVVLTPLLLGVFFVLSAAFRSAAAAAAIAVVALMNVTATFGTAALAGFAISQLSLVAIPIVITVALLDNVHVAHGYCRERAAGIAPREACASACATLLQPCAWTSITTMVGFAALLTSSVAQARELGALAAAGTAWALLSSFTVLPALLIRIDPIPSPWPARAVRRLRALHRPIPAAVASLLLVAVTAPGIAHLSVRSEFPRLFTDDHPITQQLESIEAHWGGLATVSYLLRLNAEHSYRDPQVLERLSDFLRLLEQRALVTATTSPMDLLAEAGRTYAAKFGRAARPDEIGALLEDALAPGTAPGPATPLQRWVEPRSQTVRVVAHVRMMQPELFPPLTRDLEGFSDGLAEFFDVRVSGLPLLYKKVEHRLLGELSASFAVALCAVGAALAFALRSPSWWLAAAAVNVVPLSVVLGLLGWSQVGFNSGLLMAPGIALGLIVDDTIHFVTALRRERARCDDGNAAIETALATTGAPIAISSFVLVIGFSTLTLSAFVGSRLLAGVVVTTAVLALAADLVLLPSLLDRRRASKQ